MKVANTTYRAGGRAVPAALALSTLGFAGPACADSDERRGWYAPERGGWTYVGEVSPVTRVPL
ncbi:MAG: hypothetical protein O9284_00595 [Steroidobacteraceae bacterium]|jgi:hypothetical protein|nr:hypothetical protein [Steroidobacteraceae bacterium]